MKIKGSVRLITPEDLDSLSWVASKSRSSGLDVESTKGKLVVHIPDPLNLNDILKKPWLLLPCGLIYFDYFIVSIKGENLEYSIKVRTGRIYLIIVVLNVFIGIGKIKDFDNELFAIQNIILMNSVMLAFFILTIFSDWKILKNQFFRSPRHK